MRYSYVCGIDISKNHLDLSLISGAGPQVFAGRCANTPDQLDALLAELPIDDLANVLFCAENTGMYGFTLQQVANSQSLALWVEHPGQIKACSGLQRGKTDSADAERIARYGWRYQDQARLWQQAALEMEELRYLQSERTLLVADRAKYKGQISDQAGHMPQAAYQAKRARLAAIIAVFDEQIDQIDRQTATLIASNQKLSRQYRLLQSIPGVGPRLALTAIILTKGFTCFDNARAFCCYCGIAPFVWHSGVDTQTRAHVSHRADKRMKSLLHMGAMAAIKSPGELQAYYLRKCEEGKPKMSVLNAVRSKLVHRMFAVIKHNRNYQPTLPQYA